MIVCSALWNILELDLNSTIQELDGFTFLFQRYDKFCIGGSEELLDQAQTLLQSSLDGLCYDITDISGIYGLPTRRLDIPVLQNKWPLVR